MAQVFVATSREAPLEELGDQEPFAHVYYCGAYFFLYPAIKQLRDATGELIDVQQNAFFAGGALASLEAFLMKAQESIQSQPPEWEQRVGIRGREIVYQKTSRAAVLELIQRITTAAQKARRENMGVLFLGD